ncbi:MAG: hypothetical protein INH41_03325, partial [Myxococcaceae bacterium]|nr:hypothetical protein [Myxococcaceae bacterium]
MAAPGWAAIITQPPQVNVARRNTTIWWKTDTSATTEVAYGPVSVATFNDYPNRSIFGAFAGTVHSRTLRRLAPGRYFFRVRSDDGVAPVESAEGSFVVSRSEGFPLGDLSFSAAVNAIAYAGGAWYVGGDFTAVGRAVGSGVPLHPASGALPMQDFPEVLGTVFCAVPDGAGGVYLGGLFSSVGGLVRTNLAHLLPDRGVDPDWTPSANDVVTALALSGSTVYFGGAFTQVNGSVTRSRAAAVDATTGAVTGWNPNVNQPVRALAVSGSTVYLGGEFT